MITSISTNNNTLSLSFEENPPTATVFQIKYYTFRETSEDQGKNFYALQSNVNLESLINFLKKENYSVELCKNTKKILDEINNQRKKHLVKIEQLKRLKEETSTNQLIEFSKSLTFLRRKLTNHQLLSCLHLFNCQSAANFSVPGSGKTSIVLAYYEKLRLENKVNAIFLIGPKNCYFSWKNEFIETLGRDPKLNILDKKFSERLNIYKNPVKNEIYACHFSTNSNDLDFIKIFSSNNKFLLVIDEAHNIKKIGGKWSLAALELSRMSNYKVILTGTPMPHNHKDFYNYLDFLYGENEILSSKDKAEIDILVEKNNLSKASTILRQKLNPFYVRVTKNDLNLSQQVFNKPRLIQMNPIEKKIYDAIITKIKNYPLDQYHQNIELIKKIRRARVLRLRQNCSYVKNLLTAIPAEVKEGDENLTQGIADLISLYDEKEIPAKIEYLISYILPIINKKKKVLIWSSHLKTIDLIKMHLTIKNINLEIITGKTDLKKGKILKLSLIIKIQI